MKIREIGRHKLSQTTLLWASVLFSLLFSTLAFPLSVPATSSGDYTVSFQGSTSGTTQVTLLQSGTASGSYYIPTNVHSRSFTNMPSGTYTYRLNKCTDYGPWVGTMCDSDFGPLPSVSVVVTNGPSTPGTPPKPSVGVTSVVSYFGISFLMSSGATYSKVYESKNGGSWTNIGNYTQAFNEITRDSGSYRYRTKSCNSAGCSSNYSPISATVTVLNIPNKPQYISGPSSDVDGTFSVTINPNSQAAEDNATYTLTRTGGPGGTTNFSMGSSLTRSENNLADGAYGYRVKACNVSGCSGLTSTKSVSVYRKPGVPSISLPTTDTDGSYSLSMSSSGAVTSYELREQVNGGGFVIQQINGNSSWNYTNKSNATYGYQARACNILSCSNWSGTKSVQVLKTPGVPPNFTAPSASSSGNFTVDWTSASGVVTSYQLQERFNGGSWANVPNNDGDLTAEYVSGRAVGTHQFRVRACNSLDCSSWAPTRTVTVSLTIPAISGPASSTTGNFTLSWTSGDANGYYFLTLEDGYTDGSVAAQGQTSGSRSFSNLPSGVYNFHLLYCEFIPAPVNGNACIPEANTSHSVTVARDAEPAINTSTQVAGTTAYGASVNNRGGATINVPLKTPPGVNGFQPSLSLSYDSGRATDIADVHTVEDALGYGWRLNGLPRLHRCRVGLSGSNEIKLDNSDRLCLNGQQLKVVSGSYWATNAEYRTEAQSFVKITRNTQGSGYVVRYPDGKVGIFGGTVDSAVNYPNFNDYAWHLSEMTDPMGGSMTVQYYNYIGYGMVYPKAIDYSGAKVEFEYGPRNEFVSIPIATNNLVDRDYYLRSHSVLHTVKMSMNGDAVREYRLDSESDGGSRVRLERMQECGYDQNGNNIECFKTLNFDWVGVAGSSSQYPIAVSRITDGLGVETEFDYVDISTSSNPLTFTQNTFYPIIPAPNVQRQSIAAVAEMRRSNGNGSLNATTYGYKDFPQRNTRNRGYIGFYETAAQGSQTGNATYRQNRLDFPFIGKAGAIYQLEATYNRSNYTELTYQLQSQGNGVVLPYLFNRTNIRDAGGIFAVTNSRTNICFKQLVGEFCPGSGADGEFITQTTTTNSKASSVSNPTFNPTFWGDVPIRQLQGDIQQTVISTANSLNTVSPWVLGASVKQTVTHSVPNQPSRTVVNTTTYKSGTLVPQLTTLFSGVAENQFTINNSFDGNHIDTITTSGSGVASRVQSFDDYVDDRYAREVENALGHSSQLDYDERYGSVDSTIDPNGHTSTVLRDNFGRVIESTSTNGTKTTIRYDSCDVVSCPSIIADKAEIRVSRSFTHNGVKVAPTEQEYLDQLSRTILTETEAFNSSNGWQRQVSVYDNQGRVVTRSLPYFSNNENGPCTAGCISYTHENANQILYLKVQRPNESYTRNTTYHPGGSRMWEIETVYDHQSDSEKLSKRRVSVFNLLGQLIEVDEYLYPPLQPEDIPEDPSVPPPTQHLEKVVSEYEYDAHGNLVQVIVDGNLVATMTYDLAGNRTSITDINIGTWDYNYNTLGELVETTDPRLIKTQFEYDKLGRTTFRWDAAGSTNQITNTFLWDPANAKGALASRSTGAQFTQTFVYSPIDAQLDEIQTAINVPGVLTENYTQEFSYDAQRRLQNTTYPNQFVVTQNYNSNGFSNSISSNGQVLRQANTVDAFGNVTSESFNNGINTTMAYDTLGRLQGINSGKAATPKSIQDLEYKWQSVTQLYQRIDKRNTSTTGDDLTDTFEYDFLGRLQSQTTSGSNSRTLAFDYDNLGNINSKLSSVSSDPDVPDYDYADANNPYRLTSASINNIATTFQYDPSGNGNIIRYNAATGNDTFIDYDAQNRVTKITVGSSATTTTPAARDEFWYDTDGNRFLSRETWQDGGQQQRVVTYIGNYEEVRRPGNTTVIRRVDLGSVRHLSTSSSPSGWYEYVHRDHQGSVDAITNSSGNIIFKTSFDAFGSYREENWSSSILASSLASLRAQEDERTSRGYTDHEQLLSTGFIHMNGRVYDPRIGRFISPDPIVQAPTMSASYNRYSYVFNNPMGFTDPSGFMGEGDDTPSVASGGGGSSLTCILYGCTYAPGVEIAYQSEGCCLFSASDLRMFAGVQDYPAQSSIFGSTNVSNPFAGLEALPELYAFEGPFVISRSFDNAIGRGDLTADQVATLQNECRGQGFGCVALASAGAAVSIIPGGVILKIAGKSRFIVRSSKFDYFFGRVVTGPAHNVARSAQNLKDLTTLGIKTEGQLTRVFTQAFEYGTTVSTKSSQYGTTVSRVVNIENRGSVTVSFFYQGGNMSATPSVTTIIPKIFK